MGDMKGFLHKNTDLGEQLFQIQDGCCLLSNGVDGFELQCTASFQRIQAGILQCHGSLSRKQQQQINGFEIEVIKVLALTVEYTYDFLTHQKRHCELRL